MNSWKYKQEYNEDEVSECYPMSYPVCTLVELTWPSSDQLARMAVVQVAWKGGREEGRVEDKGEKEVQSAEGYISLQRRSCCIMGGKGGSNFVNHVSS